MITPLMKLLHMPIIVKMHYVFQEQHKLAMYCMYIAIHCSLCYHVLIKVWHLNVVLG